MTDPGTPLRFRPADDARFEAYDDALDALNRRYLKGNDACVDPDAPPSCFEDNHADSRLLSARDLRVTPDTVPGRSRRPHQQRTRRLPRDSVRLWFGCDVATRRLLRSMRWPIQGRDASRLARRAPVPNEGFSNGIDNMRRHQLPVNPVGCLKACRWW